MYVCKAFGLVQRIIFEHGQMGFKNIHVLVGDFSVHLPHCAKD